MSVRIGIIGCGGIMNLAHVPAFLKLGDVVDVVACCDLLEERASKTSGKLGRRAKVYTDYKKMLEAEEMDAVYLAIHPGAHEAATIEEDIVGSGRHIFTEKPIAVSWEKACAVDAAIKRAGVMSAVGFHWRYLEATDWVREFLASAPISMVLGYYMANFPTVWWWRRRWASGGQLHEQTTHLADLCRYLAGDYQSVFCYENTGMMEEIDGFDVADSGVATFRLKNGVIGSIISSCVIEHGWGGYQIGLRLVMKDRVVEHNGNTARVIDAGDVKEFKSAESGHYLEDKAFIEAIRAGDATLIRCPYSDAIKTHAFTLAAYESSQTGVEVKPKELPA